MFSPDECETAIQNFIEIVKFPTVSFDGPDGSYLACANWIVEKLHELNIDACILEESRKGHPVVVGQWTGEDPTLPAILLNSHYDVVPIVADMWTVPAFEGYRKDGRVYGRGTQDMKCVCVQYLEALRKLKKNSYKPKRTILLSYVPDEEVGGGGMADLIRSKWYKERTIGLALDEGLSSAADEYTVFFGERLPWWVTVEAVGNTGHGSRFIESTAVEQLMHVVQKALAFREEQRRILHGETNENDGNSNGSHVAGCNHVVAAGKELGDVTSLNVTCLRSGVSSNGEDVVNVIPPTALAKFDIRISPLVSPDSITSLLNQWCAEATAKATQGGGSGVSGGGSGTIGVKWSYVGDPLKHHSVTSTDSHENPWWKVFMGTLEKGLDDKDLQYRKNGHSEHVNGHDAKKRKVEAQMETPANGKVLIRPAVFPAATDSRFLRALGVRAFGFSPMKDHPILFHNHDEYLEEGLFIEGCAVYVKLITALASQDRFAGDDYTYDQTAETN